MSANRYLPAASYAVQTIPAILAQHGLKPFISRCVLTETERGAAWLFIVLDVSPQEHPEDYAASDVLHDLSTALHGLPVVVSRLLRSEIRRTSRFTEFVEEAQLMPKNGWKAGALRFPERWHKQQGQLFRRIKRYPL